MVFKSTLNSGVRATVFSFPMFDWNALLRLLLLTFMLITFGISQVNGQCTLMVNDPVVDLNVGATNSATLDGAAIAGNVTVSGAGCVNFIFYDMLGNILGPSVVITCDGSGNGPGNYVVDVNDGISSTSNMVQLTVNTVDPTDPTFTLPNDITVNCQDDRDDLSITGDVTDEMDNCASGIQATYSDDETALTACNGTGSVVRTWTLDDGNGNSVAMDQTITVQDVTSPSFTVPADITIDACSDNINDLSLTGDVTDESDNCSMGIEATYADAAPVAGGCGNSSTVQRTWTLADDCNNVTVLQQTISLTDLTDPASTQADISQDNDTGVCGAVVALTLDAGNTSDNCDAFGSLTITNDYAGGAGTADASGNYPVGTTTVTFTITDQCSNSIMYEVDVAIADTTKPMIVNCPADATLNNDPGNCDNSFGWLAPTVSDNCLGLIEEEITVSDPDVLVNTGTPGPGRIDFADFPVGTSTITYAFKDINGNSDTCRFTVTVLDTEAPIVTCPSDQTLNFGGCNAANELVPDYRSLLGVADNCSNGFTITQVPAQNSLLSAVAGVTPADAETFTVTLTATDNNANNLANSCSFMVTLNEDGSVTPFTPGVNLPTLTSSCGSLQVCAPTAIDECGNLLAATPNPGSGAVVVGTCSPPCAPQPTVNQAIGMAIADNTSVGTNYMIPVSGLGTIIDDFEFSIEINHTWVGDLEATLESPDGTVIDLFDRPGSPATNFGFGCDENNLNVTFSDDASNTALDFENTCDAGGAFAINGSFQPLDALSAFDGEDPNGNWILNVSDNGIGDVGSVVGVSLDFCTLTGAAIPLYEFGVGSTTVNWSYDDGNGNTLTQFQLINVTADLVGPSFTCQDITVELDDDGVILVPAPTILGESFQFDTGNLGFGSGAGSTDLCFTAAAATSISFDWDYISNNSNAFFDPFGTTLNGNYTDLATGDPVAIVDIPSLNQSGSFSVNLMPGDVFCITTFTVDNAFGNGQTTVSNMVINNGVYNPSDWTETTVNSDGGLTYTAPMATDNCGVNFNSLTIAGGATWEANCGNIGNNAVTLSLSDINGNPSTCLVNITVEDNQAPVITNVPNDTTVACGSIPVAGTVAIMDNCSAGLTAVLNETTTQSGNLNTCSNYTYTVVRTWSTTDNAGNVASASQVIQIEDVDAPSNPVYADNIMPGGMISTSANSCDANVSLALTGLDDCAPFANLTISNNSPFALSAGSDASGIYPVGTHNVNWFVSDPCGNSVSFNRVFTVVDDVSPIASCKSATLGLPSNGSLTLLPGFINDGSTDNCSSMGNLTLSVSPNQFDCSHADGVTQWPVTLTVIDQSLNTATCNSFVVIQDNFAPTAICQNITVILDASGNASITVADVNNGSFDNCTATNDLIFGLSQTTFNETNVGNNFVQLSVTDSNGNIGLCTAIVTVDIPETCFEVGVEAGPAGSVLTVPITVSNFTNVGSFQFYLVASDPSILEIQNLTATAALGSGSFTFNEIGDDSVRVSYSIPGVPLVPLTLADGATIINVDVLLTGNVGDFSILALTDDDPNGFPIRVSHYFNGTLFNREPCTFDGAVSINAPASLTIAGDVFTEDADPIANVDVTISDGMPNVVGMQTTGLNGMYSVFPVFANEDYVISPVKNTGWTNGVTAFDLSEIQKHVVGLDTLGSVYKKLAADAFKDGLITTFDVLQLQILLASAVGGPGALVTPPGQTSWVFVPAQDTPATTIPLIVPPYTQTKFIANLMMDTLDNDFIGVKIGDVTGNADPSTLTGSGADNRGLTSNSLLTTDLRLEVGQTVHVPFTFKKEENWVAGQWVFDFDPSVLTLIDVIPAANAGFENGDFGLNFSDQGKLSVVAFEIENILSKVDQQLFELVFEVKAENQLSQVLSIDESILASNVYDKDGFATEVSIGFIESNPMDIISDNQLLQNRPNPFVDHSTIGFTLAESGNTTLTITDIAGRVIMVINEDRGAGYHEVAISRNELPENGVYIYRLESGDFSAVKKMTLLSK